MKIQVVLAAIGYDVTVIDNQVIFQESCPLFGHFRMFTMERPMEINNSPGIWYMTSLDSTYGQKIPLSHLKEAIAWCENRFGKSFEPLRGELKFT